MIPSRWTAPAVTLGIMITILGQVCTRTGGAQHVDLAGEVHPSSMPASAFLRHQAATVPLYFNHDPTWDLHGRVVHLQRSRAAGLLAVATVDNDDLADLLDYPWFMSARTRARAGGQMSSTLAELVEVSLVKDTANTGTRPIIWSTSDITTNSAQPLGPVPSAWRDAWDQAHQLLAGSRYRAAPKHLTIYDVDPLDQVETVDTADGLAADLDAAVKRCPPAPRTAAPHRRTTPRKITATPPASVQRLLRDPVLWDC